MELDLRSILRWVSENYDWAIVLVVQIFIAYHVFFLTRKLSNRARLEHKEKIRQQVEAMLAEIRSKQSEGKVHLLNVSRYFRDYPSGREKLFGGYSGISGYLKSLRFDGIEFFGGEILEVYRGSDGRLSFKGQKEARVFNAYPVGIVPYEWIEYIDSRGDEYGYLPLFFVHFKGKRYWKKPWKRFFPIGYPYRRIVYYRESERYREGNEPPDMKYMLIDEPISDQVRF